jgi:glutamate racemase
VKSSTKNKVTKTDETVRPIGVFDSGIGGLTVVAALRELLPAESIVYIGDTARVPYGGKSQATIERYSVELAGLLLAECAKCIVVACNTASALGVPRLKHDLRVPVTGVIEPGAQAAVKATRKGKIGVKAYERAIEALDADIEVIAEPCPLFVPLIEEGWLDDPVTDSIIARYLEKLLRSGVDTIVLGCTHYPLLREAIQRHIGPGITLVDSAQNTALAVQKLLKQQKLSATKKAVGKLRVSLTDQSTAFLRVAEEALGLQVNDVHLLTVQQGRG